MSARPNLLIMRIINYLEAKPKPAITSGRVGRLQRKCACGQHTGTGDECAECRKKREGTLQRAAIGAATVSEVPPIVHEVLRSPGRSEERRVGQECRSR